MKSERPRHQRHIVETFHDGSLKVDAHLDVGSVLDVVAIQTRYLAIYDHVLGVESTEGRAMVVDDLEVNKGNFLLVRQTDRRALPRVWFNDDMVLNNLGRRSTVVHEFDYDLGAAASFSSF